MTNDSSDTAGIRGNTADPTLELPPEHMRDLGYAVIDAIVDHLSTLRDQPTARWVDRASMEERLQETPPREGSRPVSVLNQVLTDVLAEGHRNNHPRYFGYVPNPSNFVGAMGDALAAGFNTFAGMWAGSPGAAQVELVVIDWLRQWCGLPDGAGGVLLSGSSMANLVGIAAARHARFGGDADAARQGTIYLSDQAHSSVAKGARLIGIGADRLRRLPSDADFRLPMEALASAVKTDRDAGLDPFCVVAATGTTNTAAVDPLPELASFCAAEGLWLHADGAFAAATMLTDEGRRRLEGLERADSIALDAHKWLFQPIECGCLLVRDVRSLRNAFHERPEYLLDVDTADAEINFCDLGPQLTREFRALKLWMSIKVFGVDAFTAAIERGMALAELAERELRQAGQWEIITRAQLGVLTFGYAPRGARAAEGVNSRIAQALLEDGFAALSTTRLHGETVLRMCVTNPRATDADVVETVRRLGVIAKTLAADRDRESPDNSNRAT